jgi:hypothetical protein
MGRGGGWVAVVDRGGGWIVEERGWGSRVVDECGEIRWKNKPSASHDQTQIRHFVMDQRTSASHFQSHFDREMEEICTKYSQI